MKVDPRHQARKLALLKLYAENFGVDGVLPEDVVVDMPQTAQADMVLLQNLFDGLKARLSEIDQIITESAPEWPLDRISKIDLAILRISVYELVNAAVKPSIAIDEAVELAKEFGGENSSKFVNGVLGSVSDKLNKKEESN